MHLNRFSVVCCLAVRTPTTPNRVDEPEEPVALPATVGPARTVLLVGLPRGGGWLGERQPGRLELVRVKRQSQTAALAVEPGKGVDPQGHRKGPKEQLASTGTDGQAVE